MPDQSPCYLDAGVGSWWVGPIPERMGSIHARMRCDLVLGGYKRRESSHTCRSASLRQSDELVRAGSVSFPLTSPFTGRRSYASSVRLPPQRERLPLARKELHALLEDPELQKMPLLVLGNKIDLEPHMSKEEIIKGLNLDYIQDQPWECMAISGLRGMGVERVIDWLIAHARK